MFPPPLAFPPPPRLCFGQGLRWGLSPAARRLAAFPPPPRCVSPAPSLCFGQGLLRGLPPAPSLCFPRRLAAFLGGGCCGCGGCRPPLARPTVGVVPRPLAYVLGKAYCGGCESCRGCRPPPPRLCFGQGLRWGPSPAPPSLSCVSPAPSLCFGQGLLRGLPPAPSLSCVSPAACKAYCGGCRPPPAASLCFPVGTVPRHCAVFWARPTAGVAPRPLAYVLGKACGGGCVVVRCRGVRV